jgi:hypothetical protein
MDTHAFHANKVMLQIIKIVNVSQLLLALVATKFLVLLQIAIDVQFAKQV